MRNIFPRTCLLFSGPLKPSFLTAAVQLENSAGLETYWCFQTYYEPQVKQTKASSYFSKEQSQTTDSRILPPTHLHNIKKVF